jgi:hypothetical protein
MVRRALSSCAPNNIYYMMYYICSSAPGPTIPGFAHAKPWMGGGEGGTAGRPNLNKALGLGVGIWP